MGGAQFEPVALRVSLCVHFQEIDSQMQPQRVMCHCTIGSKVA
jgi:hypothetical protein